MNSFIAFVLSNNISMIVITLKVSRYFLKKSVIDMFSVFFRRRVAEHLNSEADVDHLIRGLVWKVGQGGQI